MAFRSIVKSGKSGKSMCTTANGGFDLPNRVKADLGCIRLQFPKNWGNYGLEPQGFLPIQKISRGDSWTNNGKKPAKTLGLRTKNRRTAFSQENFGANSPSYWPSMFDST